MPDNRVLAWSDDLTCSCGALCYIKVDGDKEFSVCTSCDKIREAKGPFVWLAASKEGKE